MFDRSKSAVRILSLCAVSAVAVQANRTDASELQGYTEPFRTINVASDETGTVAEVLVKEGQFVDKDQPLMRLNSQVQQAQLDVAKQQMLSEGPLQAAQAEVELTHERLERIESLRRSGHARQAELQRAGKEHKVAEANLRTVREDLETRRLEYEQLAAKMQRRVIRAPVAGVVTELHREPGEYVAPNKPDVVTLVQLKKLLANFAMLISQADQLEPGQKVSLRFFESQTTVEGKVHFISPVTDAESGTVLVKVMVDNTEGLVRSGARCSIELRD